MIQEETVTGRAAASPIMLSDIKAPGGGLRPRTGLALSQLQKAWTQFSTEETQALEGYQTEYNELLKQEREALTAEPGRIESKVAPLMSKYLWAVKSAESARKDAEGSGGAVTRWLNKRARKKARGRARRAEEEAAGYYKKIKRASRLGGYVAPGWTPPEQQPFSTDVPAGGAIVSAGLVGPQHETATGRARDLTAPSLAVAGQIMSYRKLGQHQRETAGKYGLATHGREALAGKYGLIAAEREVARRTLQAEIDKGLQEKGWL